MLNGIIFLKQFGIENQFGLPNKMLESLENYNVKFTNIQLIQRKIMNKSHRGSN